jgi:hypothetical protein
VSDTGTSARRVRIAGSAVATVKGDDGTTGLLYGGRITKVPVPRPTAQSTRPWPAWVWPAQS